MVRNTSRRTTALWIAAGIALATAMLLAATPPGKALAQAAPAAGTNQAVNQPDRFAWELFAQVNAPAEGVRVSLPGHRWNDERRMVQWQTWISTFTAYGDPCQAPTWPAEAENTVLRPSGLIAKASNHFVSGPSSFNQADREQVMVNRAFFDYVVDHGLWFSEGVLEAAAEGKIDFPEDAIIVKANWAPIEEKDRERYLWQWIQTTEDSGDEHLELVGLNAFHVVSKALPNWFWSTFEHVDNPGRCDAIGCRDAFGSDPAFVPPHRRPGAPYPPGNLTQELQTLLGSAGLDEVWKLYRLKGTQVDFTDALGRPNLLGNSVLEPYFEATSSCMTCHTRAAVSNNTTSGKSSLSVLSSVSPLQGHVGTPDPAWFQTSHSTLPEGAANIVWRTDFLWELTELLSREETCGGAGQP